MYYNYEKPLFNFIKTILGSSEDAEEELQQLFVNIWLNRQKLNPSQNIKNYLYVAARNNIFKRLNTNKKSCSGETAFDHLEGGIHGADDELIAKETKLMIDIAVDNMPKIRKKVFELYVMGYDNERIANELGITRENAKRHLTRARKDIKDILYLIIFFMI